MPIQFPTSPSVNQEYTYEGKVWQWDGSAWVGVRQETGIQRSNIWSKQNLLIPKRGFGLNSGYNGATDQRRTQAGTINSAKHYMERNLGAFTDLWTPSRITTALWLDAADASTITLSGFDVTQWNDKSGNGLNCFQPTSANRPIIASSAQNGLNTIRFVDSDYLSSSGNITLTTEFTVFVVAKNRIRKDYNGLLRVGASALPANNESNLEIYWQAGTSNSGSGNIVTVGNRNINFKGDQTNDALPAVNNYYIHSTQASGTNLATRYQNGTIQVSSQNFGTGVVVPSAANPYHVGIGYPHNGNAVAACLDGDICEIVVLDNVASTNTRQLIEGYLAHKWGLEGELPVDHRYKSAAPDK